MNSKIDAVNETAAANSQQALDEIAKLKAENTELRSEMSDMKSRLAAIEKKVGINAAVLGGK